MIDWSRVTLNMQRKMPLSQVALLVECEQQTLTRLARCEVKEPKFSTGIKLLDLHLELCEERHNNLWI